MIEPGQLWRHEDKEGHVTIWEVIPEAPNRNVWNQAEQSDCDIYIRLIHISVTRPGHRRVGDCIAYWKDSLAELSWQQVEEADLPLLILGDL